MVGRCLARSLSAASNARFISSLSVPERALESALFVSDESDGLFSAASAGFVSEAEEPLLDVVVLVLVSVDAVVEPELNVGAGAGAAAAAGSGVCGVGG